MRTDHFGQIIPVWALFFWISRCIAADHMTQHPVCFRRGGGGFQVRHCRSAAAGALFRHRKIGLFHQAVFILRRAHFVPRQGLATKFVVVRPIVLGTRMCCGRIRLGWINRLRAYMADRNHRIANFADQLFLVCGLLALVQLVVIVAPILVIIPIFVVPGAVFPARANHFRLFTFGDNGLIGISVHGARAHDA